MKARKWDLKEAEREFMVRDMPERSAALRYLVVLAIGIAACALIGYIDIRFITGRSVYLFYAIAVLFATWHDGRAAGMLLLSLSAIAWFVDLFYTRPVSAIPAADYSDLAMSLILLSVLVYLCAALKKSRTNEKKLTHTDYLTGVANRMAFYDFADFEIKRAKRYKHPFTIAYIDIDNFKLVNYRFGHATGDKFLSVVAQTIKNNIRDVDVTSRFGGDEFALLLPETPAEPAQVVLSRLRAKLLEATKERNWPVTFSFGIVTFLTPPDSVEDMIKKVGTVMYAAKDAGTNIIDQEIYPPSSSP